MKWVFTLFILGLFSIYSLGQTILGNNSDDCPEGPFIIQTNEENFDGIHYIKRNNGLEVSNCFEYPTEGEAYFFGNFDVVINNLIIPGTGENPEMFLYAYGENFNDIYGVSGPLIFEEISNGLSVSAAISLNLNEYFLSELPETLCPNGDYRSYFYVTLAQAVGENSFEVYDFGGYNSCWEGFEIRSEFSVCCASNNPINYLGGSSQSLNEFDDLVLLKSNSIRDGDNTIFIKCFPNPFTETLFLQLKSDKVLLKESEINFTLYDMLGRKVFFIGKDISEGIVYDLNINLNFLEKGIYFYSVDVKTGNSKVRYVTKNKLLKK